MIPAEPKAEKAALRRTARRRRRELIHDGAAEAVRDRFLAAFDVGAGATVGAYLAMRSELDPAPLVASLRERGAASCMPITERAAALTFRAWAPGDPLVSGPLGTREPAPSLPVVRPDVLLVPLLAFDADGGRLGYGGGHYDRTLAALRPDVLAVGVALDGQRVERVPRGPYDQVLDAVVTERAVYYSVKTLPS